MWKRAKLLTLVVLTIGLSIWIYPIWKDFTGTQESTLLMNASGQNAGGLTLFVGPGTTNDIRMNLIADYASETDNGGGTPTPTGELTVDGFELTTQSLNPAASYLVASGSARLLLNSCKAGFAPDASIALSKLVSYGELPDQIKQHVHQPVSALEIHGIGVTCPEPSEALWAFSGPRHTFSSPWMEVVAEGPIDKDLRSKDTNRGTENGPFCARVI